MNMDYIEQELYLYRILIRRESDYIIKLPLHLEEVHVTKNIIFIVFLYFS